MKKIFQNIIKMVSAIDFDMTKNYKLYRKINNVISFSYKGNNYKRINNTFEFEDRNIPISFFIANSIFPEKLIIYFHGGGWVIGDTTTYNNTCARLAIETNCIVAAVDYRLAPEYPFPNGLMDCYEVTRKIFLNNDMFGIKKNNIILMGDSAGANMASVVSIIANEKKEFFPKKQILLYPVIYYDHSRKSPYYSVIENGKEWGLTSKRVDEYMNLYVPNKKDRKTKYVAPILSDNLINQPKTLIITAEYDPLRDEGEAYGKKLEKFGNEVEIHRLKDGIHGFFSSLLFPNLKKESLTYIKEFINGSENNDKEK